MIARKEVESLDNSSVKLTVTVQKENVKKTYDDLITKYCKTAHIRGFRKGKVPPGVLIQKYGDGLLEEARMALIEESLKTVVEDIDQKPLPYSTPVLQEKDGEDGTGESPEESGPALAELDLENDYTYSVVYDIFPEIKPGEYTGISIEVPGVKISKEDEQRELDAIREQNAMVAEKSGGAVAKDDIVTVNYRELDDENKVIEGTEREGFVFTAGSGYNVYKFDDDIIGMEKGQEKIIEKEFPEDYEQKEYAGKKVKVQAEVTTVKTKQLPELDDELAQDVSDKYKTLGDLKADLKKKLESSAENRIREMKIDKLFDKIIETSEIALPKSMMDAELENSWYRFVQQSRMQEEHILEILEAQGKGKEALYEEWKPKTERSLKTQLLIGKLQELEKIEVTEEEVEAEITRQAEESGSPVEEVREFFDKNNLLDRLEDEVKSRKLFDLLLEKNTIKTGKKLGFRELMRGTGREAE